MRRRKHHDLEVWQDGIALVELVYKLTERFPNDEKFGLTSQMRRAAISVPSNVAEGAARATDREFMHFLVMARASLSELETQALISERLAYMEPDSPLRNALGHLFGKLGGLIKTIERRL